MEKKPYASIITYEFIQSVIKGPDILNKSEQTLRFINNICLGEESVMSIVNYLVLLFLSTDILCFTKWHNSINF